MLRACSRCCAACSATPLPEPSAPAPFSSPCLRGRSGGGGSGTMGVACAEPGDPHRHSGTALMAFSAQIAPLVRFVPSGRVEVPLKNGERPAGDVARLVPSSFSSPCLRGRPGGGVWGMMGLAFVEPGDPHLSSPSQGEGPAGAGARLAPSSFSSPCFRGRPGGGAARAAVWPPCNSSPPGGCST
jgi:hypothetical protein